MSDEILLIKNEDGTFSTYNDAYDIVIHCETEEEQKKIIERLKATNWIPVSERLPEERDWFLAVFRELDTGYQLIPRVAEFINRPDDEHATSDGWHIIDFFERPKEYIKLLKCVAWMHLPEPYKED
nr:MAG TPA_asm: Protein of unknown function (DUF551) [Caudoviricetes sp.]